MSHLEKSSIDSDGSLRKVIAPYEFEVEGPDSLVLGNGEGS